MVGNKSSNSNHSKTSILELLNPHRLLPFGVGGPKLEVVNGWFSLSQEGFAVHLCVVFPGFEDSAKNDELGPPLGIALKDGIDGVSGGDVLGVEDSEDLGEEPSDGGKHGGAAVGEFGSAGPVNGDVVTEAKRVELERSRAVNYLVRVLNHAVQAQRYFSVTYHLVSSLGCDSNHTLKLRGNLDGRLGPGDRGRSEGGGRAGKEGKGSDGLHFYICNFDTIRTSDFRSEI